MSPLIILAALSGLVLAQDTYHCPDGWLFQEDDGRCYYFSTEAVTKNDADILCAFHEGWLAEIDIPRTNYWVKAQLIALQPGAGKAHPGTHQYWIGAVTEDHHNDHVNGNWRWQASNTTVTWFDWGQNEPNDYHTEFCMTYLEYRETLNPFYLDYFWNDYGCDSLAHYICQKNPMKV